MIEDILYHEKYCNDMLSAILTVYLEYVVWFIKALIIPLMYMNIPSVGCLMIYQHGTSWVHRGLYRK